MKNLSPYCHQQPAVISEQIEDHIPQPSSHFCESYCLVRFTAVPGQYSILPSNQARKGWLLDRPQYHQMWINPSPISRFSIGETKKHIKNIVVEWHISRSIQDSTVCFDLSNATLRSFPASGSAALPQSAWILDMTDTVVSVCPWHLTYSLTGSPNVRCTDVDWKGKLVSLGGTSNAHTNHKDYNEGKSQDGSQIFMGIIPGWDIAAGTCIMFSRVQYPPSDRYPHHNQGINYILATVWWIANEVSFIQFSGILTGP